MLDKFIIYEVKFTLCDAIYIELPKTYKKKTPPLHIMSSNLNLPYHAIIYIF